jgi:glycosyltransferase 2 family protein
MSQSPPETESMLPGARKSRHPLVKALIRVGIGGVVIAILLSQADLHKIGDALGNARPGYIVGAAAIIVGGLFVSAYRWHAYLDALEMRLPIGTLVRLYFVGTFFNAFLPTGVGGDAYKAMRLRHVTMAKAFASVLLDRLAGVVGVALVGIAGVLIQLSAGDHDRVVALAALLSGGVLVAALLLLRYGDRLIPGSAEGRWDWRGRLKRLLSAFAEAGRHPRAALRGFAAGGVFQGLALAEHVMLARALGLHVPVGALACIVVIATLATAIPFTINGLGFREGAYVWTLHRYGVLHDPALAFALLVLGVLLAASAVGGLVYMIFGGEVGGRTKNRQGVTSAG